MLARSTLAQWSAKPMLNTPFLGGRLRPWPLAAQARSVSRATIRKSDSKEAWALTNSLYREGNTKEIVVTEPLAKAIREVGLERFLGDPTLPSIITSGVLYCMARKYTPKRATTWSFESHSGRASSIEHYEKFFDQDTTRMLMEPRIWAHLLVGYGHSATHHLNRPVYKDAGIYAWRWAADLGAKPAAVYAWQAEEKLNKRAPPPDVVETVKALALSRSDWRAMATHLGDVLKRPQTATQAQESYLMARDLYDMVQPGKISAEKVYESKPLEHFEPAWHLLNKAADTYLYHIPRGDPRENDVQDVFDTALREGVSKWTDPNAARRLADMPDFVQRHSPEWVELKTQIAMRGAGSGVECMELAKYYLQREGWYPAGSKQRSGLLGLEWLQLSAILAEGNAKDLHDRYLTLALVMRENAKAQEGLEWLNRGRVKLQECKDLDPSLLKAFDAFIEQWDFDFSARAEHFLGPPVTG